MFPKRKRNWFTSKIASRNFEAEEPEQLYKSLTTFFKKYK